MGLPALSGHPFDNTQSIKTNYQHELSENRRYKVIQVKSVLDKTYPKKQKFCTIWGKFYRKLSVGGLTVSTRNLPTLVDCVACGLIEKHVSLFQEILNSKLSP